MKAELELGNVDLLTYQQSVGGSIFSHDHATNDNDDFEDPLLECRRQKDDEEIIVPELWEIVAPVPVPSLPHSVPVLPSVPSVPPTLSLPVEGQRHSLSQEGEGCHHSQEAGGSQGEDF